MPKCFSTSFGGNGECHCWHVSALANRVDTLEAASRQEHDVERRAPLIPERHATSEPAERPRDNARAADLGAPLKIRPLGVIAGDRLDRQIFDDKMATQSDMRWDGGKGGPAWKSRVQSYFWSKVPALLEILKWAEKHDKTNVTETAFNDVVTHFMEPFKQQASTLQYGGSCHPVSQGLPRPSSGAPKT